MVGTRKKLATITRLDGQRVVRTVIGHPGEWQTNYSLALSTVVAGNFTVF